MTTQERGVTRKTIVFAVMVVIIVVGVSGVSYYLTHTYTNPVTILSEELDLEFGGLTENMLLFPIVIDNPSTQIRITLEITSGSIGNCGLWNESTESYIYEMRNDSSIGIGVYTSDWMTLSPGNYSVVVEYNVVRV
ncbi:MAG: hypothetical protein ACXAEF_03995 [Candidatus Thorarchaeota archaeon]|jgi:hypothetical protein